MNAIEILRGFFFDLWHMPFLFKVGLLAIAGLAGRSWWEERQRQAMVAASATWPVYRGRVVAVQASDRKREGRHGNTYWAGLLTYSYTVPGQPIEVGEVRKKFYVEEEADAWARGLRETEFVSVRVDPYDAGRSVWDEGGYSAPSIAPAMLSKAEVSGLRWLALVVVLCASGWGRWWRRRSRFRA